MLKVYRMFCTILYHLYNVKNIKNTHGGMSLLKSCVVTLLKVILLNGCFKLFKLIFEQFCLLLVFHMSSSFMLMKMYHFSM